jgi:hypothetical protein
MASNFMLAFALNVFINICILLPRSANLQFVLIFESANVKSSILQNEY